MALLENTVIYYNNFIQEGIVITGCADGLVRAYNLHTGRYMW